MSKMSKSKRNRIRQKTDGRCWYCGCSTLDLEGERFQYIPKSDRGRVFCVDHVVPRQKGGKNAESNLVCACWYCNTQKGAKSLEEFRDYVAWKPAGGQLNALQIEWLESQGVKVPQPKKYVFFGETKS